MDISGIMAWFQANWGAVVAIGWTIDQLLKIISPLTSSRVDDNLSDLLGKLLAKVLPKPK